VLKSIIHFSGITLGDKRAGTLVADAWFFADVFYEWQKTPEGEIPYSIEMKDASPFFFTDLWDGWQNPDTKEWLQTCLIITGETKRAGRPNP
jgi:putative SOS response-associated peptidase YedK